MIFETGAEAAAAATAKVGSAAAGAARCGRFGCASAADAHVAGLALLALGGCNGSFASSTCARGANPGSAPGSSDSRIDAGRWSAGMGRAGSDARAAKKLVD